MRNVKWPTSSTPPTAVVGTQNSSAYVGVSVKDLEALSFAFGYLMALDAHVHAGELHTLRNRVRMALSAEAARRAAGDPR